MYAKAFPNPSEEASWEKFSGRMPWQSPCWLSQGVSPLYGKLQKGFGCIVMRSGHLLGFAEKPFPLWGNSTHRRPCCSAKSRCKPLLPALPAKQSDSKVLHSSFWDVLWWGVPSCRGGWARCDGAGSQQTLPQAMPPPAALPPWHCGQGAILSAACWGAGKGGEIFLRALSCCAAPQNQVLRLLLCLPLMEGINRLNK